MQARGVRAFGLFSIDGYYFRGIYEPPEGGKMRRPPERARWERGRFSAKPNFAAEILPYMGRPIQQDGPAANRRHTPIANITPAGGSWASRGHRGVDTILAATGRFGGEIAAIERNAR